MKPSPAVEKLWEMGIVGAWYLTKNQLDAYELLKNNQDPFLEAGRRFGKSTTGIIHVIEKERQKEGQIWRWCEPWKNQAREIVIPEMENLQRYAPKKYRWKYYKTDSLYAGPNGGKLYLRGVNEDKGESARGPKADGIVADEIGSWAEPDYILKEVLRPQLLTTNGQLISMGTPPPDLGHPFYAYKEKAIRDGRFLQKTVYHNDLITPEKILKLIEECGGPNSPAWRREYLCEPISEPDRLVIPEFTEAHVFSGEECLPKHFDAYVGCDLGFNDNTALIFGVYDFLNRTLLILDELVVSGKNSKEIAEGAKAVERRLWGDKKPYLRISDNDKQQLYDMSSLFGYQMLPTRKDDKLAAINQLRVRFTHGKIKIHERCQALKYQLKVGLWNEKRTDYLRGDVTGHLDAIDALVYLNRNVNEHRNPYPADSHDYGTHHIPTPSPSVQGDNAILQKAFESPFARKVYH